MWVFVCLCLILWILMNWERSSYCWKLAKSLFASLDKVEMTSLVPQNTKNNLLTNVWPNTQLINVLNGYSKKTTKKEGFLKMSRLIKLKGTDRFLKFLNKISSLPEIHVPSHDHKWTSLAELLTSANSVSADMTSTVEVQMYYAYIA